MNRVCLLVVAGLFVGCGGGSAAAPPAQEPAAAAEPAPAANAEPAAKPDEAKLTAHIKEHVKYPATRAELLAACADTPEFTAGEKQWIADHLPEGSYASSDDVLKALQ